MYTYDTHMNNKTWTLLGIIILIIIAGGAYMIGKSRSIQETVLTTEEPVRTKVADIDGSTKTKEADGKYIGFITDLNTSPASLTIDYIQWIECQTNVQTGECMNGFKIVNQNPQLRTFTIAANAPIAMQTYSQDTDGNNIYNQPITLQQLDSAVTANSTLAMVPYWITIENGIVTSITEQYVP